MVYPVYYGVRFERVRWEVGEEVVGDLNEDVGWQREEATHLLRSGFGSGQGRHRWRSQSDRGDKVRLSHSMQHQIEKGEIRLTSKRCDPSTPSFHLAF